jgi:hypothetical protein
MTLTAILSVVFVVTAVAVFITGRPAGMWPFLATGLLAIGVVMLVAVALAAWD